MSIQSYTPQAYDCSDLDLLETLADHCGGALERLRVEAALRESQAQLARTESFALVMTAHVSLDGRWLKVPPTLCALLGTSEAELLGAAVSAVTHPDHAAEDEAERRRLAAGEVRSSDLEIRLLRRDGRPVWVYLNRSVVQDAAGTPLYLLTYLRDVTDRRTLEDQLRQAQKMEAVGQLAGGDRARLQQPAHRHHRQRRAAAREMEIPDARRLDLLRDQPARRTGPRPLTRQLLAFSRQAGPAAAAAQPQRVGAELEHDAAPASSARTSSSRLDLDPGLGPCSPTPARWSRSSSTSRSTAATRCRGRHASPSRPRRSRSTGRTSRTGPDGRAAGPHVLLLGERHGHRHGRADPSPAVRAVLHHQGAGPRAPGSGSPRCTASCGRAAGTSGWTATRRRGAPSPSTCPRRKAPCAPTTRAPARRRPRAARAPSSWWRTRRRCGRWRCRVLRATATGCSRRPAATWRSPSWARAPIRSTSCSPTWSCPA